MEESALQSVDSTGRWLTYKNIIDIVDEPGRFVVMSDSMGIFYDSWFETWMPAARSEPEGLYWRAAG